MGFVYFVETKDGRFVKIGYSEDPLRRMGQLKRIAPEGLSLQMLGCLPGSPSTDRWLHDRFDKHRDHGEWFRSCEELRGFISAVGLEMPAANPKRPMLSFLLEKEMLSRVDGFRFASLPTRAAAIKWLLDWALSQKPVPEKGE